MSYKLCLAGQVSIYGEHVVIDTAIHYAKKLSRQWPLENIHLIEGKTLRGVAWGGKFYWYKPCTCKQTYLNGCMYCMSYGAIVDPSVVGTYT